ncbi:MAG: alpha-ketoglutarate-dependent dioxygenase AlkB [Mucilaginibacter sp.]|jgi:alkylated DNA repair dioxygenase AlkB|nr:alpha-ketoglutarate-dependent dioxygenase AlkB [Mucilaginibacter sp.]
MEQLNIFGETVQTTTLPPELLEYHPGIFDAMEAKAFMSQFISNVPWQQRIVTMYGKQIITPRLTAWYGDTGSDYTFSGTKFDPLPWTKELLLIKRKVETIAGINFNSVLLNYYRNGNDSVAWHSDDENELGVNPVIASLSFGQARRFDVRQKTDHQKKYSVDLQNGSLLLMKGDLQHNWEHRIAKSTKPLKERVNLTFRVINKVKGER